MIKVSRRGVVALRNVQVVLNVQNWRKLSG